MGFYRDSSDQKINKPGRLQGSWRWVAIVAVSALVGSGTTFAMIPAMEAHGVMRMAASAQAGTNPSTVLTPVSSIEAMASNGISGVVKKVKPAVMGVVNYSMVSDYFSQAARLQPTGVGTGVLFDKDSTHGYAVTNNHVVEGAAKVEVVLASGKHVRADVVGTDPYTDLAVLRIPQQAVQSIKPIRFANSDDIEAGEPAIAIGTPMGLDFADSVTAGIVSAKTRIMPVEDQQSQRTLDYQAVVQTDAAINPGNSGGPLLNIDGEVIGINSSKIVAPNFEGMGFAIPSNEVKSIADQIMKTGHAMHPALGIQGESLSAIPQQFWPDVPVNYGVWIKAVASGTTKASELQQQDVIVGIDGKPVKNMADLRTYLFQKRPGDIVTLQVYRGEQRVTVKYKLTEMKSVNTTDQSHQSGDQVDPLDPFGPRQFGE